MSSQADAPRNSSLQGCCFAVMRETEMNRSALSVDAKVAHVVSHEMA